MKEILIINLMRLGDLIQSTPLLRAVRQAHPKARITLMVQDIFQEIARLIPGYDRLLILEFMKLAPLVDQEAEHLPRAFQYLSDVVEKLKNSPPDLVINLTPNRLGAILSYLAGGQAVRGLTLTADRQFRSFSSWMSYLLCASRHRRFNPFNLVDQFTRGSGYPPPGVGVSLEIPPLAQQQVEEELSTRGLSPETCLIGLQPGASALVRQWPPENFVRAARLLLQAGPGHFLLFGTEKERSLGEAIRSQLPAGTVTSLMGKTTVSTLAAYLARVRLLITNDTGTMHVACGVGTPVLALFLATARVWDTGPTGKGHLALQPRLDCYPCQNTGFCSSYRCHQALKSAAVAYLARQRLAGTIQTPIADGPLWEEIEGFISDYDDQGYQIYRPLIMRPLDRDSFWNLVMQLGWRRLLDGHRESLAHQIKPTLGFIKRDFLPPTTDLGGGQGHQVLTELIALAREGARLSRQILPPGVFPHRHWARIKQSGDRLAQIDGSLARLARIFPEIASLVEMFFMAQRHLEDNDLLSLARHTHALYCQLHQRGKTFQKIISLLTQPLGQAAPWKNPGLQEKSRSFYPFRSLSGSSRVERPGSGMINA